jgi:Ser/Thr protein kinase RdoA (MazF antagonist)
MLKLKYLYDNRNLAEMILKNWDYDQNSLNLFDYYRISANAVYPFEFDGTKYYLRFSPVEERSLETIQAELEYLSYLHHKNYPAVVTQLSKNSNELEIVETPWGVYLVVVFKGVPGRPLNRCELTDNLITGFGQALGKLHKLSREYSPVQYKRISWRDQFDWMNGILAAYPEETKVQAEIRILGRFLEQLPATSENYGLVHYDFEIDNVFFDEKDGLYQVIDFDDSVYHWFALDIDQSLESLNDALPLERQADAKNLFIRGYRSEMLAEDSMLAIMPVFRRYVNLLGYVRILRSIKEQWNNEPDWMVRLRQKLLIAMEKRRIEFGEPISGASIL